MSTREEREQRVAEVRAERAANVSGTSSTTKTGGTTASGNATSGNSTYTTKPSANMTPTQIKAWEKNRSAEKLQAQGSSNYVSRAGSADSSAYASAAKDRAEKQRRTLTPTTIRAIDNSYNDSNKQYYYGKSKYTTDSTDAEQQAYVRGMNMWGDTTTWYDNAGQTKSRAEKRAEELKSQLAEARRTGTYGVWDNGVYMGESTTMDSKATRLLELQYEAAQKEATRAAKEYEYAQSFYNYDQQVKQNEADKVKLEEAKARGLSAEDWYTEAQTNKDNTWETVQILEGKLDIAKDYAERAKAMAGDPDFDQSLIEYYNGIVSRLQTRYDNALAAYNDAASTLESASRMRFEDVRSDPDWQKKSTQGAAYYYSVIAPADTKAMDNATRIPTSDTDGVATALGMIGADKSYLRPSDEWSTEEKSTYFYLVDKEDMSRADEFARQTNAKYANAEKYEKLQKIEEWSTQNFGSGALATAASVGAFLVGGADMAADVVEYAARGEITAKPFVSATEFSSAVTSAVSNALNQKYGTTEFLGEQRGLGDMYQVAASVAQSMASIALGSAAGKLAGVAGNMAGEVGSLAVFFGSSGAMGIDEALERGASPEQAIAYGVLKGGIEVLTEKFSVENLLTNVNIKTALQSILMQAGIEASEESMSTLLGTVADAAVMGDKSELHVARYYYLSQGYSMEEANKKASTEWLNGLAWDAISGALSGGMSAGLNLAGQAVKYNTVGEGAQQRAIYKAETKANANALVPAITARLNELGQTDNVNATAQSIANKALGTRDYSNDLIMSSRAAQQAYNELTNANTDSPSTAWAREAIANRTAELTREAEESRVKLKEAERTETATTARNTTQTQRPTVEFTASYKGQDGEVTALVKDGHNNYAAKVVMPNGKEVTVSEQQLTFDESTQELIETARPYAFANEVVTEYLKGSVEVDPPLFVAAFKYANMFGSSTKLTAEEAYNYSKRNGEGAAAKVLTREQFTKAFNLGRKQAESRVVNTASAKRDKGEVHFGKDINHGGIKYTGATENMVKPADLDVLKTMAKVTGVDIYFYESPVDGGGKYQGANGFYRNGSIYLDVHAMAERTSEESAVLLAAAHEMTHYLRQNNEQGYTQLRDFVVEHLMEDGVDIEKLASEKVARENSDSFTMDDAMEEVIADSCELMLEDTRLPDIMARENPSLLEQIRDWLKDFTEKLRTAFRGVEAKHAEAQAMLRYADELQQLWDNAMAEAVRNSETARESGNNKEKHSYAGRNARTADIEALTRAEEMERNGEDWDTIRKETGWFRGMDNQWRFEINDSDMEFRRDGDARLLAEPEYQQLAKLTDKWAASFDGGEALTTAEENEMARLEEKYGADVWEDKYMLRDFVKHDELFDAYPRLKGVGLEFDTLPDGVKGFYSKRSNTIVLSESLFGKEPDVVLHEIQHVIQKIEGFTSGTNVEYWNKRMEDGYSKRGSHGFEMMPSELYRNTAGEIEARDTASRRKLTAAERKATSPVRANEDTVFADDSGVSYSKDEGDNSTIKKQLKNNLDKLNSINPVATVNETNLPKGKERIRKWAVELLKATGYKVDRQGFGIIEFSPKHIDEGIKYLSEDAEVAAFAALPRVLKRGIVIDTHEKHKGNLRNSVTIAAPVVINGVRGNMAVAITVTTKNHYHVHRIVMPDGSRFTFDVNRKKADPTLHSAVETGEEAKGSAYDATIPHSNTESKTKNSARDVDLQAKYPRLNLNEDISELDGVPAIELVDGSVLPITDRSGRYPTHVSFIEANRIDVDDLKSGGWIGNGVYDSSFQSDTARYIERESARKRVAELTGKPYNQFERTRYSMRDVATNDTAQQRQEREKSYADLKRQNAMLERRVEYWKAQTKQTQQATIRKADTDKLANRIARDMGLTDREAIRQVKNMLEDMGNTIVQSTGEELTYTDFKSMAQDIADYALNNVEVELDTGTRDMYDQLRSYLKGTTLRISENEVADLDENFRRSRFGSINISTKKGLPVDTAYMELTEMFGEGMFPSDVYSQADMLNAIADNLDAWKPRSGNPYEYYMNEVREHYAQEIIDAMFSNEIRQTAPTYADKAGAALESEKAKSARQKEKNREQREEYERKLAAEKQQRERLQKRMSERIKQIEKESRERQRQAVQDERAYQLQRQERAQKVKNINKISDSLMRKLTENSGKNHIPDYLKEPVAQLLKSIDTRTTYTGAKGMLEFTGKMEKLAAVIANYGKSSVDNDALGNDVFIDFPPDIAAQMREFSQSIREKAETRREWKLESLSLQELQELEEMMQTVSHAITEANELYTYDTTVREVSQKTVEYLDGMRETRRTMNKFLAWDNLTPVYFFKRLGEGGEKIFKSLTKGWGDLAFKLQEIKEFTETLYQAQEAIDAGNTIIEFQLHNKLADTGLTNENTVSVKFSKAQIMSIYGLTLRGEQAIRHMLSGGITLRNIKQKGKLQDIVQNDDYLLTTTDIEKLINDNLTARDKEIVRAMVKFMSTTGSKWGNAVTQARWGIDKFTEENYFPITTDKRSRDVRNNDSAGSSTGLYRLVNMGFTKELTPDAKNPIVIDNVFDVFANHMADMAKYGSLALPILDMMKFINYRAVTAVAEDGTQYTTESVRKAMDMAYGTDAQDYLVRFMRDLNSSNEGGITGGVEKLVGHYKRAAVGANLRVALLQPTSIARAAMVISPKYIAKGMASVGQLRQSYSEAMMNSGAAMWKSQGFYDVNVNRSMRSQIKHDETTVDKVVDMSMWFAEKGDQLTWSQLWTAAKAEQMDKARQAGETLTDEQLMQRTTDRFEEIIYQTQVMDSTLTRSQLMRSKDGLAKAYTAFMAEPTLSYNTLLNMYSEFSNESRRTSKQAAWQKLGNKIMSGFAVYVVSQALSAAVESIADAWRDDDEYMTFMEKWMNKMFGEHFFDGNLAGDLSVIQKLPIAKDLLSALQGEESTRMEMEGMASVYTFLKTSFSKIQTALENGEDVGKVTGWGWIEQGLRAVSQVSGLPGYNLTREVVAMWNNTIGAFTGDKIKSYKANPESEIKTAYINGYLTEEEAHALLMDADVMGDKVYFTDHAAETKIADWTNDGTSEMYNALYEAMEDGDKQAFEIAMQSLTEGGSRYRYDVITNVRKKIQEWYVGDERGATKLNKEMAEQMLIEYGGYTKHDAHTTIQQQTCAKVEGFSYSEKKNLFLNGDLSREEAIRIIMTYGKDDNSQLLVEYADKEKAREYAEKQVQQWQMALDTQIDYDEIRSAYDAGEITDAQLVEDLIVYGGMDEEAAENKAYLWKWKGGDEDLNSVTGAQARRYDAYIAGAGIDMTKTQYANYIDGHLASTFKGDLKEGSTTSYVPNSKRNKIWAYIDTLPLTPEEKDAMAIVYAYDGDADRSASSTYFDLQEAPWNL